jgi:hypothetical protein
VAQIDGGHFAAAIDFHVELVTFTLIDRRHACAFNRRDVDEGIRLSIIAFDKAEAFHRVEELDCTRRGLTGQLTLNIAAAWGWAIAAITTVTARSAATVCHRKGLTLNLKVSRGNLAATVHQREAKRLTFGQTCQPGLFNGTDVNEHIFTAIIANDETETFLAIEKLYDTGAFANDLRGHLRATTAATATTKAATAAAAEAISTASAAAEPVSAATAEAITTASAAAKAITAATTETVATASKTIFAKAIPLIEATSATFAAAPSIKTHARQYFPKSFFRPVAQ